MQWRRDLWLLVLAIGAGLFVAGERALAATNDPSLITPLILIGAATAPAAFTALSYGRELRCTLPGAVLIGVAVLAGLFGAAVAGLLTYGTLESLGPLPTLAVALVEEGVALLVPLAVLWALPGRRAADGLLVGAASGAGFAAAEALSYLITALVGSAGAHALLVRVLLGTAAHLAWTSIAATALWLAVQERWSARSLRRFVLAAAGVVLLHTLWEIASPVPLRLGLTAVTFALLGWVVRHITPARRPARPTTVGTTVLATGETSNGAKAVRKSASPAGRLAAAISRTAHHTGPSRLRRPASLQRSAAGAPASTTSAMPPPPVEGPAPVSAQASTSEVPDDSPAPAAPTAPASEPEIS
jgi:RsiW-degrading membrane proteinase PrsW (M82 family)